MKNEELIARLENIISGHLSSQGLELVELIFRPESGRQVLRVLADRPGGGISMGDCARLNREIGDMLESEQTIGGAYNLEVCSPGLDRPIRTRKDFARSVSKTVKCFLKEPINGKIEWDGVILSVTDAFVSLRTKQGVLDLPVDKINMAKPIII